MLKPKDGNGFEVNDWGTDMAEDANSITAPVPPPLTDLPAAERRHPLFRQGYNLGYAHRAQEEALADQKRHSPPSFQAERTRPPRSYNVTVGGLLGRLSPGVRTDRDLIAITDSAFTCETPCCGREITVPIFQEEDQPQLSATLENEAIATVESEATQTDWLGDLSGGLGVDPQAGRGGCSAAPGSAGSGCWPVDGRAGRRFAGASEV